MVWWVAVCMQFVYYPYAHTQWRDDAVVPSICLYVCLWTSLHAVKKTSELLLSSSLACPFFDSIVHHDVTEWVSIFLHPLSQSWEWNLQTLFHLNTHVTSGIRKDICQHSPLLQKMSHFYCASAMNTERNIVLAKPSISVQCWYCV